MRRPLRSEAARQLVDLAVDLGDPGRMARARRLDRAGRVGTVDVGPGRLSAVVHDDIPAEVTISLALETTAPGIVPAASSVSESSCSCGAEPQPCRHGLAMILALAAEVELDPELLTEWTSAAPDPTDRPASASEAFDRGPWDESAAVQRFERRSASTTPLIVDGVDAGPVIVSAVEAAGRRRRSHGFPQPRA